MKTKLWFAEQIMIALQNDYQNIDTKLDERDVLLRIDSVVNDMAKKGYLENWKMGYGMFDEQYITTWPDVTVIDQEGSLPSYLELPSNYVAIPNNGGIVDVVPVKWRTATQPSVVITTFSDYRKYQSNPAGNMQGRLTAYPQGQRLYFTTCDVKKVYGNMIVRLAIRDSSMIGNDDPYPVPADKEGEIIVAVTAWYRARREVPTDTIRDNIDKGV